jgi:serine/threonine-protein kinase
LERIVPTHPSHPQDAELIYQLAMLLENEGRIGESVRYYERLLVFDINYRDVPERLKRLKESFTRSFSTPSPVETTPSHPQGGETQRLSERYEILEELGRGGMGIVFKARDQLLDRLVALKVVRLEDVTEGSRDRLLTEARVAAKLNHPNIVQIYDCAFARGFLTLAMEYVEGQSLREILAQKGPFPLPAALLILGQVARALEYAHGIGIVHRDIKPANILWTPQKSAKLTDFGIARMIQDLKTTRTLVVGTPLYMAPEQITGRGVDHRADIYSLGVTFYELLTGAPPFPHGDVGYHHIHTPPPDPRTMRPDLPEPLLSVIFKLLAKSPDERYSSATELIHSLKPIVTSLSQKEPKS